MVALRALSSCGIAEGLASPWPARWQAGAPPARAGPIRLEPARSPTREKRPLDLPRQNQQEPRKEAGRRRRNQSLEREARGRAPPATRQRSANKAAACPT